MNCPICGNDAPASSTFAGLCYCPVCNLAIPEDCPGEYQGPGDPHCWECANLEGTTERCAARALNTVREVAVQGVNDTRGKGP